MTDDETFHDASFMVYVTGGITTLWVSGDLDLNTLDALFAVLERAVSMAANEMVVDLSAGKFLCSRSLGLIEAAAFQLRERRARLIVRDQPPSFDLLTRSVGTYEFFAV